MANDNYGKPVRPSVRPSILREVERVKGQVEYDSFGRFVRTAGGGFALDDDGRHSKRVDPIFGELCLIIAEVNLMNGGAEIKVDGLETSAFIVQEVYTELRAEHLEAVAASFELVRETVRNKKAYLRTALYNAVFELYA